MNADEIIKLQERLEGQDGNFRGLWQETADYIFPRENEITREGSKGQRKGDTLYDVTAILEAEWMTSGLLTNLIPTGQRFFSLTTSNEEIQELDIVKSHYAKATETLHEQLFASNFLMQLAETLRSLISFGTGNIFSEWKMGLNFTDWDIGRYQLRENFRHVVDTDIVKFKRTARQAYDEWGSKAGKSVVEIFEGPQASTKKEEEEFWFIHIVQPRKDRNPRLEDGKNMPWESAYVNVKDKVIITEGGFHSFPYQTPRWTKTTGEVHGRGIGTMILPQVKVLQSQVKDLIEVGNKAANPSREILESFEGEYDTSPGGRNNVMELPSSHVDERNSGNFPVNKDIVLMQRELIQKAFYADAFAPLGALGKGDRRNELEIQQRIREAFRRIAYPILRLKTELFSPLIKRCYGLMVVNGVIDEVPEEITESMKVDYKGQLWLAQEDSESTASQNWVGQLGEAAEIFGPSIIDNVNQDKTARRWARTAGVNEEDIATIEEVAAKREERQAREDEQRALEAAQVASGAYGQTTKAPEPGSAAEQLQNA